MRLHYGIGAWSLVESSVINGNSAENLTLPWSVAIYCGAKWCEFLQKMKVLLELFAILFLSHGGGGHTQLFSGSMCGPDF